MFETQSRRAIIRTVVDTIKSGTIVNQESRKSLNDLYLFLEQQYDLQFGKVLLALSSMEELEEMMDKDWPFFAKYSQEVDLCLNGTSCDSLNDVIATLGKKISYL